MIELPKTPPPTAWSVKADVTIPVTPDAPIGGTVIRARGSANPEAEEFFSINIQPDKEVLLILVSKAIKDDVLKAIYKDCGLADEAKGIAFSLPVNRTTTIKE